MSVIRDILSCILSNSKNRVEKFILLHKMIGNYDEEIIARCTGLSTQIVNGIVSKLFYKQRFKSIKDLVCNITYTDIDDELKNDQEIKEKAGILDLKNFHYYKHIDKKDLCNMKVTFNEFIHQSELMFRIGLTYHLKILGIRHDIKEPLINLLMSHLHHCNNVKQVSLNELSNHLTLESIKLAPGIGPQRFSFIIQIFEYLNIPITSASSHKVKEIEDEYFKLSKLYKEIQRISKDIRGEVQKYEGILNTIAECNNNTYFYSSGNKLEEVQKKEKINEGAMVSSREFKKLRPITNSNGKTIGKTPSELNGKLLFYNKC